MTDSSSQRPKVFRDPVHDIIRIPKDTSEGRVLLGILASPELQRLRRIRQLGFTNLVYHGAEHSRFVHSMGVSWLAGRMYDVLRPKGTPEERLAVVTAALCHDLGHGPFSHVAERIGNFHHEDVTVALILSEESGVNQALRSYSPDLPERVARFYDKRNTSEPLREIVSSQLDADRMDYILRDGLATGVKIGVFDTQRILSMLEVHDGRMCVSFRATEAVEGYLLARFHMYKQVYLHKASRAAERMLEAAIRRARELDAGGYNFRWFPTGPMARLVRGTVDGPRDIPQLDDMDVWYALKRWSVEDDPILVDLAGGLVHRRLYKTVPIAVEGAAARIRAARELAESMGYQPDYHVLVDSSADTPYKPYVPDPWQPDLYDPQPPERADESIRIITAGGIMKNIEDVSDIVRLLGDLHYQVRRLVVPAALAERLKA